jgi:hypothetical protein
MSEDDSEPSDGSADGNDGSEVEDPFVAVDGVEAEDADDPFADLDDTSDGESSADPFADTSDEESSADPFADIEGVEQDDDPFTDLSVGGASDPSTDDGPSENTLFTDEGADDIDDGSVWSQLEGESADDGDTGEPAATPELDLADEELDEAVDEAVESAGSGETVVKKRSYCEQCEYFSEPPDISCTYPGSQIIELVDTGRFRVRDCPIVERRENSDISSIAGSGGSADGELEGGEPTGGSSPELEDEPAGDSGGEVEGEAGGSGPELEGGEAADGNADD